MPKRRPLKPRNDGAPASDINTVAPAGVTAEVGRANINRVVTASPSFVSIYANDVQVQTTPWDIRLIFGTIQDLPDGLEGTARVMQMADLHISPQLAKTLAVILIQQIAGYEANFGTIPQPRERV
jgi:hypothetical protein